MIINILHIIFNQYSGSLFGGPFLFSPVDTLKKVVKLLNEK